MAHQIIAYRRASAAPNSLLPGCDRRTTTPPQRPSTRTLAVARVSRLALLMPALVLAGCGGTSEETAQRTPAPEQASAAQATEQPGEVVSQFLDRVRRGGDDSAAGDLLTKLAKH